MPFEYYQFHKESSKQSQDGEAKAIQSIDECEFTKIDKADLDHVSRWATSQFLVRINMESNALVLCSNAEGEVIKERLGSKTKIYAVENESFSKLLNKSNSPLVKRVLNEESHRITHSPPKEAATEYRRVLTHC